METADIVIIGGDPFVRFGEVDPFDPALRQQCADARSGKIMG